MGMAMRVQFAPKADAEVPKTEVPVIQPKITNVLLPTELQNLTIEIDLPPPAKCQRHNEDGGMEDPVVTVNGLQLKLLSGIGLDRWVFSLGKHYVLKIDRADGVHPTGRAKAKGCILEYNVYKYARADVRPCLARVYAAGTLPRGNTWCIQRRVPMEVKRKKAAVWRARKVDRRVWFHGDMHEENFRTYHTGVGTHQMCWDFSRSIAPDSHHDAIPGFKGDEAPPDTSINTKLVVWKMEDPVVHAGQGASVCLTIDPVTRWDVQVLEVPRFYEVVTIDEPTLFSPTIHQSCGDYIKLIYKADGAEGCLDPWMEEMVDEPADVLRQVPNVWDSKISVDYHQIELDVLRRMTRETKREGRRRRGGNARNIPQDDDRLCPADGVPVGGVPSAGDAVEGVPEGAVVVGAAPPIGGEVAKSGG